MDLLFKRYASPFLLLDGLLQTGRFTDFILKLPEIINEEKTWEVWLHRAKDKTYDEFTRSLRTTPVVEEMSKSDLEATIKHSRQMLTHFKPV